ncbi:MAG TPA: DNA-processing protein DprA [bacterium]|nr:DNA-processing protein DprA [bacterium]
MNQRETLLALHLTGVVGPRRLKSIREAFSEISDVFGASEDQLSKLPDWTVSAAQKVLGTREPLKRVEQEVEKAEAQSIKVLVEGSPEFPKVFEHLYDPPFVLWRVGNFLPEDENAISVIGCRKPSAYGRQAALKLSEDIAKAGYTVVSGLARGIDSLAHIGALKYPQGRTIAFLGSGLLNMYPPENRKLSFEIAERGAVFSEYPLMAKPLAMHFPQRNRLISGAGKGLLVVEAKKDSGSFITVDHAMEQGKPVFAVPGPITHTESEGAHALIQQGAKLVMGVEDIFHELQDMRAETVFRSRKSRPAGLAVPLESLSEEERKILEKLSYSPIHVDLLMRETQLVLRRLNELLLALEMKGLVQQAPGHCYFRV